MPGIRLQRFLAQAGVAARRKAEGLMLAGRVTVNGKVVTKLGTKVDPDKDSVAVDGISVEPLDYFYCVLNKPKGCVTTVTDPHGRRTVMEYLNGVPAPVVPVGRLDFYSEGVLLLTNDGELAAGLLAPKTHVEKTYHVKLKGTIGDGAIARLRKGVRLDDGTTTRPAQVDRLRHKSKHAWLIVTLTEGKSRQIHRMGAAIGLEVTKIQRVAFAGIGFHGLRVGDARELTQAEVNLLYQSVGLKRSSRSVARGKWSARREDSELSRRARDRDRPPMGEPTPARPKPDTSRGTPGGRKAGRGTPGGRKAGRGTPDGRKAGRGTPDAGAKPTRRGTPTPDAGAKPTRRGTPTPDAGAKPTRRGKPTPEARGANRAGKPKAAQSKRSKRPARPGRPGGGRRRR